MNALTPVDEKPKRQLIEVVDPIPVLDTSRFEHMQRIANVMAQSTLIPESLYKEKDGELPLTQIISNCFLVVNQAVRWGLDPFAVAQSVAVVRGKLCYEGKLVSAVLDAKLGVRLHYHFTGDPTKTDYRIYISDQPWTEEAIAAVRPGMTLPGARIVDGSVAEWQAGDKSPWAAPKNYRRMLIYRGTRDWARFYEPAVLLGVYTPDEMIELAEGARASRAREVEGPSVMQRLQARHEGSLKSEGFDQSFVTRETAALTGEADSSHTEDNSQSSVASPDDGSSGGDTASSQTAAATNLQPDDESGTSEEGDNTGQVITEQAAPSSDPVKRLLCEELVDNMIRDAFSEPAIERPAKLDKLRDAFLLPENLGDEPDFIRLCHETARRIIGNPAERERAREFLTGKIPVAKGGA